VFTALDGARRGREEDRRAKPAWPRSSSRRAFARPERCRFLDSTAYKIPRPGKRARRRPSKARRGGAEMKTPSKKARVLGALLEIIEAAEASRGQGRRGKTSVRIPFTSRARRGSGAPARRGHRLVVMQWNISFELVGGERRLLRCASGEDFRFP